MCCVLCVSGREARSTVDDVALMLLAIATGEEEFVRRAVGNDAQQVCGAHVTGRRRKVGPVEVMGG